MHSFAEALRRAAEAALPKGAFLRRDRGEDLFVTDAPRRCPDGAWAEALAEAGFLLSVEKGLARLLPGPGWLERLEAQYPEPPDFLSASLFRLAGLTPEAESLRLFALGARILDGEKDDGRFERRLRQRAAVCLRLNGLHPSPSAAPFPPTTEPRGGGLYACALLDHIIREVSQ